MKHLTRLTRSFVFLIIITLVAAYGALVLARYQKDHIPDYGIKDRAMSANASQNKPTGDQLLSTQDWKTYEDGSYPLEFKYPATWKVSTNNTIPNYYAVELKTDKNQGVIKVYISKQDFFALKGLATEPHTFGGREGKVLGEWVYALKAGDYYYTFDSTETVKPLPELRTIISTAKF